MADLKTHCEDYLRELGQDFKYAGPDHMGYRHNRRGVEEVRRRWGDRVARAAEIHIRRHEEKGHYILNS